MKFATVLKILTTVALVVVVALIAASKALDSKKYQAFLADRMRDATGLELSFTGPTKIKLGLSPQVSFTGLTLSAKPGGPALLFVDRIEAQVALLPLVFRMIQVERAVLIRPMFRLGSLPHPVGGLDLDRGGEKVPATSLAITSVQIEDGTIIWRDVSANSDSSMTMTHARIQPESVAGGPLSLQIEGRRNGTDFRLAGVVGSASALLSGKKPYPIQLKGEVSGAVVVARGHVAEPLQGRGVDLEIKAQGDELADMLIRAGMISADKSPSAIGPYKISAKLSEGGLTEIDAIFGKRDNVLVGLKGAIKTLSPMGGFDLAVMVESDGLAGLSRLMAVDLPNGGPLKLSARLNDIDNGWRLTGIKSSLGKSDFSGELALVHTPRPRLFGRLVANVFVPSELSLPQSRAAETARSSPQRPAIPVHDGRILSLAPLPLEWLKAFDLNLSLGAAKLHLGAAVLSEAVVEITLASGKLTLGGIQAQIGEGVVKGDIVLDNSLRTPGFTAKLAGSGLDLTRLGGEMGVDDGLGDFTLEAKMTGASARAMAGSLEGSLNASLSNAGLSKVGGDLTPRLMSALDPTGAELDRSRLRCASLRLAAKGGSIAADRNGLVVETSHTAFVGSGSVDLRTEGLDMAFAAKGGAWTRIRGMLSAPSLAREGSVVKLSPDSASCRILAKSRR